MTESIRRIIMGSLLIILGAAFLLRNMGIVDFEFRGLWPWLLIVPGVIFWIVFFVNKTHYRLILPGTILITYGALFLWVNSFHIGQMHTWWPVFILGPGLGFLLMYVLGQREPAHLRTGSFLTLLAIAFFVLEANPDLFWPVLLIGIGILMLGKGVKDRQALKSDTTVSENESGTSTGFPEK